MKRTLESVAALLRQLGIERPDDWAALAAPSIRIAATRAASVALGAPRFGGSPDVPAGFVWPERAGRPLGFLAQLDLAEVRAPGLPSAGWLLFFYDDADPPWGFRPSDAAAPACSTCWRPPMSSPGCRTPEVSVSPSASCAS